MKASAREKEMKKLGNVTDINFIEFFTHEWRRIGMHVGKEFLELNQLLDGQKFLHHQRSVGQGQG